MSFKKTVLFICLCILSSFVLDAQSETGERVKNRAENRANQRVDQKVDQAVDRAAQKIEGLFRRKKKDDTADTSDPNTEEADMHTNDADPEEGNEDEMDQEDTAGFLSGLNMGGEFEPYENPVKLNVSMSYHMTNTRGKESSSVIHYTLDTWQTGIQVESEDGNMRMIMDNQEGSMTMITTEKGETSGYKMRQIVLNSEDVMPEEDSYNITALGNNRVIDGYNCTDYLIEHEDGTTTAWMTTELDEVDMTALMRAFVSFSKQSRKNDMPKAFIDAGFPIESTTVSKNEKETIVVKYYDINFGEDIDKSVFDTRGIKIMSIGF